MQAIKCVVVGDGWDVEFILAELCLLLQCRGMQLLQERGWGLHGSFGVYGDVIEHSTSPVLVHEKQNESGVLCWNKADNSRAAHQHRYIKHPCQCSRVGGWVGEGRRGMGGVILCWTWLCSSLFALTRVMTILRTMMDGNVPGGWFLRFYVVLYFEGILTLAVLLSPYPVHTAHARQLHACAVWRRARSPSYSVMSCFSHTLLLRARL